MYHPEIGYIDLAWGQPDVIVDGQITKTGYGLSHIIKKHVEFQKDITMDDVFNIQNIIENSVIVARNADKITLRNENFKSAIRLDWNKKEKKLGSDLVPRK